MKPLVFGVHFGVHILIFFPLTIKALRVSFSKSFFVILLNFKLHQIHLIRHELIRKMGVETRSTNAPTCFYSFITNNII